MDSLEASSGKERVRCQGGQSRVETNVYQDEVASYADGILRRFLHARCRRCSGSWCLQESRVGADAALPRIAVSQQFAHYCL